MKRAAFLLIPALLTGCGTDVAGPGGSLFTCLYSAGSALEQGEVLQVTGAANQGLCLADGPAGEFLYIPFFARASPGEDSDVELPIQINGVGFATASDPAPGRALSTPLVLPGGSEPSGVAARVRSGELAIDWAFHDALRRREIRELGPRIRPSRGGPDTGVGAGLSEPTADAVPAVGDLLDLNTMVSCTEEEVRTGRVEYVSEHAIVVADKENPEAFTPEDYEYFAVTFDTLVYPVETAHFGSPTDIDGNGRSILFFTRAVNERTPASAPTIIIGFFWSGDLFPDESTQRLEGCPAGNNAEMFYLIAPDPRAEAGRRLTVEDVRELTIPLIGHEFQHLVNASRRLFVNDAVTFEEPWLNEGLSHVAEELLFFEVADLDPGRNLGIDELRAQPGAVDAFNEYMGGNFSNFRLYLSRPDTASLMGIDLLSTRGATWSFLRYAADRSERGDRSFYNDLVNSRNAGLDNLAEVLGADEPLAWMQDWTVSVFGDDFVAGLDPRFAQQSWDLRSLYESTQIGRYPLETRRLGDDATRLDLLPGGAAYTLFDIPTDGRGVLHVESDGELPPSTLRGSILRIR
jgi:hypothetical protein